MSEHKDCGEEIRWAKLERDHERFLPPLEFAGEFFIIDADGVGVKVMGYRRHICDPDKVRAWQALQQELADLGVGKGAERPKYMSSGPPPGKCGSQIVNEYDSTVRSCKLEQGHLHRDGTFHESHHGDMWNDDDAASQAEIEEARSKYYEKLEIRREAARQRSRDKVNKPALLEACPRCYVGTGTMCISLSKNPGQAGKENKYVHPERQELARKNGRYPDEPAA